MTEPLAGRDHCRFACAAVGLTVSETVTCAVAPVASETSSGRAKVPACDGVPVSSPPAERWRLALRRDAVLVRQRSAALPVPARSFRSKRTPTRPSILWCVGTASVAGRAGGDAGGEAEEGERLSAIAWRIHVAIATPPAGIR